MSYVDGFVIPVPKKNIAAYRRLALKASQVWKEHGALDYYECVGDDLTVPAIHLERASENRAISTEARSP